MPRTELDRAIVLAILSHEGQTDKTGEPYILHPLRVMQNVTPRNRVAAVLHDVIEDNPRVNTTGLLTNGISAEQVELVWLLTRRPDVPSRDYYAAIKANPDALEIKLADIDDNTDPERLAKLDPEVSDRLIRKYNDAWEALR